MTMAPPDAVRDARQLQKNIFILWKLKLFNILKEMETEVSYLREILDEQKIPTLAQFYFELSLQFASKSVYFIVNSID